MAYANWEGVIDYAVGDIVQYFGVAYIATAANTNITPPAVPWAVLAQPFPPSYAEFASSASQNLPAAAQTPITFSVKSLGTADITPTGAFPTPSATVATAGVYRVIFSAQLDKFGGGGNDEFQLFFSINGNPVPNTNSKITTSQQVNQVMTVESFFALNANDTIGVIGYTPVGSVSCRLLAQPVDGTHPVAIPSIIFNIQRIG